MFQSMMNKLGFGKKEIVIGAPTQGRVIPITEVSDPTFAEEILGKGVAIEPTVGRVVAPVDGVITIMFETKHAVSIQSDDGAEILVHIGLDTVMLKGKYYKTHVTADQKVKKGDLLVEFDIEKIKEAGYSVVTPVVICNSGEFKEVIGNTGKDTKEMEEIIRLVK